MANERTETLVTLIAQTVDARLRCLETGNDWADKHEQTLQEIARQVLPSGSGIDSGTSIDLDRSTGKKLVFHTSFHHMNDGGMYGGWTEHSVIVTPSLISGFDVRVTGRDRNKIKDYLADEFRYRLSRTVRRVYDPETERSTFMFVEE